METRRRVFGFGGASHSSAWVLSATLLVVVMGILSLSGCAAVDDVIIDVNPAKSIALSDLVIDPAALPYVTAGGEPFYQYQDPSKYHDFREGTRNPWLLEGPDLSKWIWLIDGRGIDSSRVTGILRVILTDSTETLRLGYDVIRFDKLTQPDIDSYMNYLVRQGKDRFKFYVIGDMLLIAFTVDYHEGLAVLCRWLEEDFGLLETPIELRTTQHDLVAHIDTQVTEDFKTMTYPPRCSCDGDCAGGGIEYTCLKCPGGKIVFHNLTCERPPGIAATDSDQGICWLKGAAYPADGFYTGECVSTAFCLIDFEGQEVPTACVEETRRFLPIWKEALLRAMGASEAYYHDHFYVHSTFVYEEGTIRPEPEAPAAQSVSASQEATDLIFLVNYYYVIDWVTIRETSQARVRTGAEGDNYLDDASIAQQFTFRFNHPIEDILSKNEVLARLDRSCRKGMRLHEENVRLTDEGRLELLATATIDEKANRCMYATVDLESGEIIACHESVCWVE